MSEQLKPCPFCGGEAELIEVALAEYCVACPNSSCMASSKVSVACMDDASRIVIEAWNRRAPSVSAPSQPPAQSEQDRDADMFWNDDDPEWCSESIHEVIDRAYGEGNVKIGDAMTIQRAIRLSNVDVVIVAAKDDTEEFDYDIVDAAMSQKPEGTL